ncbi:MAG: class I SAM-dependent methyltransferase [Deltaproteobacteria bacterium]|nr:class I SAM-dependent methyltransferase [Deltaproteobacteria bacterium]
MHQVFEVDHPATQQWKQARLRDLNIEPPPNLTFIPLDFEKRPLPEGLQAGGYRPEAPAFFSWLGVTMYLTEDAIFQTLRAVASSAPGSEIVFDYPLLDSLLDEENRRFLAALKAFGAEQGEPWVSLFEPAGLAARVKALGFTQVLDFSPEEAFTRYFTDRPDGLRPLQVAHLIMKARAGDIP